MNKLERIKLLRALAAADNAFHDALRERGYSVSYGLDDPRTGSIIKMHAPITEQWPLGTLSIQWKLKEMGI